MINNSLQFNGDITPLISHSDHIGRQLNKTGSFYELPMLDYIRNHNIQGIYVDAGSNIGNHAVFFAKYCTDKVIAIEPVPSNYKILQDNITINQLEERIEPMKIALTLSGDEFSFDEVPDNMGMCSIVPGKGIKSKRLDSVEISEKVVV